MEADAPSGEVSVACVARPEGLEPPTTGFEGQDEKERFSGTLGRHGFQTDFDSAISQVITQSATWRLGTPTNRHVPSEAWTRGGHRDPTLRSRLVLIPQALAPALPEAYSPPQRVRTTGIIEF